MIKDINKANEFAKKSCTKWNKNVISRKFNRSAYQKLAMEYCESDEHRLRVGSYKAGNHKVNTYPWPYIDDDFAAWPESVEPEGYTLVGDQSGCVIKYATSYCAYKIYETRGAWPHKQTRERLDAAKWQQFLKEAGYIHVLGDNELPKSDHHYVGIKPNHGEWGLVVWFENITGEQVEYSTYDDKRYVYATADAKDFTWVQI